MIQSGTYKIRPAGRHVLTIGRDLIQDVHAAVVELVKNAYDADSRDVEIAFTCAAQPTAYKITITDHGHGMSHNDVIHKWLVPSTTDKVDRPRSPSGRVMQGRKGVGRYAASVLGSDLWLETVTGSGERTEVYIQWDAFEDATYLDDVDILVDSVTTTAGSGTRLTITGDSEQRKDWNQRQFDKLRFELRKLKSPIQVNGENDDFEIRLVIKDFPGIADESEIVEPYPIIDLFDYRVAGCIDKDGKGEFNYSTQKIRNSPDEVIQFDHGAPTECGQLIFDLRVYDRDRDSIRALIDRGLKDDSGSYVGNLQARQLLNEYNGIGVYRNGFRLRPMGDPDFDWLKLNEQRVQNPSLRISSNQVIGVVQIESEEHSGLVEKSARDGLREDRAFDNLKNITQKVVGELESRRFRHRRMTGITTPVVRVERQLDRLFSSEQLKTDVSSTLRRAGVAGNATDSVLEVIDRDEEARNQVATDIRRTVAVYQGQATLGKIVYVILHEGRRPLSFFRNEINNLKYWHKTFVANRDRTILVKILSIAEGIGDNADFLVKLFGRLDPLAAGRRPEKIPVLMKSVTQQSIDVFSGELKSNQIVVKINCPDAFEFVSWRQDIFTIFVNLIDNSIYWMKEKQTDQREICIDVICDEETLVRIDYKDTGPGIEPEFIANGIIFEPEFTTKMYGTGLGLPIAGEAATRIGLDLKALESETGAWFRLEPEMEQEE